jgi:CheY-like chemotaxis protein
VSRDKLAGLRVLIVEDDSHVSMLLQDMVAEIGCAVAAVASELDEAKEKLSSAEFDAAILDLNLNGARAYEIAESLARKRVPFVFSTGYGSAGVPQGWPQVPVLAKPFGRRQLEWALKSALESQRATP